MAKELPVTALIRTIIEAKRDPLGSRKWYRDERKNDTRYKVVYMVPAPDEEEMEFYRSELKQSGLNARVEAINVKSFEEERGDEVITHTLGQLAFYVSNEHARLTQIELAGLRVA